MELNKLCIILPADFDEIDLESEHPKNPKPKKKHSRSQRTCGAQIVTLLKNTLVNFCHHERSANNHDHHDRDHDQKSGVFYDTEGAQIADKVGSDNPRIFSYSELYIATNGFSAKEVLGSGGFGRVYKATLPSDNTVAAVKCLAERGDRFEKTFMAELVAVAHLRHRNLVRLRGWCVHDDQLFLVYDYMPNKSLDQILFKNSAAAAPLLLSWQRRSRVVAGLATALLYLHEQLETQIIHRDVKASNVMLDANYNARLGDFGLARWLDHDVELEYGRFGGSGSGSDRRFSLAETTKMGGTIGYLPPESFRRKSVATAKSDVFSFGIVALEVVSGRRAVDLTCSDEEIVLLDWVRRLSDEGRALQVGDVRIRDGSYGLSDMGRLIHLALLCTVHDPNLRPNMRYVVDALSGNISGKLPPLPSFKSHPPYISLSSPTTSSSSANTTRSSNSTSTTTTIITIAKNNNDADSGSNYATALGDTIFATAESGEPTGSSGRGGLTHRRAVFPMVKTPREISYAEIVAATENFSDARRVAELDFGTAYEGFLKEGGHVLVKRLGMKTCPALRVRFAAELQNLGRLRHRSLVQLRGWCTEQGEMLVVYDYSANRLLPNSLFGGGAGLRWRQRYGIVKSLASAVHYLHEEWEEQVIHRGITSSAVILDPDMNPRLGSFALAEFLTRNEHGGHHVVESSSSSVRGIFGYMSPEYLDSGEATTMADVYSFGVVVLEVVSGQMAVDFRRPEVLLVKKVHEFVARKRPLEELADFRLDGEYDRRELVRLVKLGIECTKSDPNSRPSMRQIVRILDGNDEWFAEQRRKRESMVEWKRVNACSLSLVKRIQALGIQ